MDKLFLTAMNGSLTLAVSWWYVPLCVILALGYAFLLYQRGTKVDSQTPTWLSRILPILRFCLVFLILFLLLGPMWKGLDHVHRSAKLLVVIDNSASMAQAGQENNVPAGIREDLDRLGERFDLRVMHLDEALRPGSAEELDFEGKRTDYGQVYGRLMQAGESSPDAVLLYGDGLYNKGKEPVALAQQVRQPLYLIGLGDSTERRDLAIRRTYANPTAMVGSNTVFNMDMEAWDCAGESARIKVKVNNEPTWQEGIPIDNRSWFQERSIGILIPKEGMNRIEVELEALDGEQNLVNNRTVFYIKGVQRRQQVEIWSKRSHPDVGTWRTLLESKENYEVELVKERFEADDQSLVVLFDWFRHPNELNHFEALKNAGIPVLIHLGPDVRAELLDRASIELGVVRSGAGSNQVLPAFNRKFEQFQFEDAWSSGMESWPPLRSLFGSFRNVADNEVLCYQKLGNLTTDEPLILVKRDRNYHYGLVAGTGIWAWRMADYRMNGSHELLEEILGRMAQFAAEQQEGERLRLDVGKSILYAGETQRARAILLDRNGDAVLKDGLPARLIDPRGQVQERVMAPGAMSYDLELQGLSLPGEYRLQVEVTHAGEQLKAQAVFTLSEQDLEALNQTADFKMMRAMGEASGGQFSLWGDRADLIQGLSEDDRFLPRLKEELNWQMAVDWKALFWAIVLLLAVEWGVRKYIGRY